MLYSIRAAILYAVRSRSKHHAHEAKDDRFDQIGRPQKRPEMNTRRRRLLPERVSPINIVAVSHKFRCLLNRSHPRNRGTHARAQKQTYILSDAHHEHERYNILYRVRHLLQHYVNIESQVCFCRVLLKNKVYDQQTSDHRCVHGKHLHKKVIGKCRMSVVILTLTPHASCSCSWSYMWNQVFFISRSVGLSRS